MIILKNIFYYFQMSIFPPRLSFSTNYLAFLNFLIVSKLRHMVDPFVNTSPLSEGLYDAILPLRILLWMAIHAGIKHIACR